MRTIPNEVNADGLKIMVKLGGLNMPLSDEMVKKYCGSLPKTEKRAWAMARRLRGKVLEFPNNISFGELSPWDKRDERIARRIRRESDEVKVSLDVELEEEYDDAKISLALLEIEEVEKVKSVGERGIVFNLKKTGVTQKRFAEEIYPLIKEKLKDYVKRFKGHDFGDIR